MATVRMYSRLLKSTHAITYAKLLYPCCSRTPSVVPASPSHPIHTSNMKVKYCAAGLVAACPPTIQPYLRLMRADKPTGTWLILWPGYWSVALASGCDHVVDTHLLALFGAGAFLMRSAGCVINDLWDKDFDCKVERTKLRPLASGELNETQAFLLLSTLLTSSLLILLQLNWVSIALGFAVVPLVVSYPLAKRFTYFPQVVLGLTLNWGVVLGCTAAMGYMDYSLVVPTYFSALCWTLMYDTIYAHQDKTDDIVIGVKSLALKLGDNSRPWLYAFAGGMVGGLAISGMVCNTCWPYYLGLSATAVHLLWQVSTVNFNSNSDCWSKFKSNIWLGGFLFAGILGSNALKNSSKPDEIDLDCE